MPTNICGFSENTNKAVMIVIAACGMCDGTTVHHTIWVSGWTFVLVIIDRSIKLGIKKTRRKCGRIGDSLVVVTLIYRQY